MRAAGGSRRRRRRRGRRRRWCRASMGLSGDRGSGRHRVGPVSTGRPRRGGSTIGPTPHLACGRSPPTDRRDGRPGETGPTRAFSLESERDLRPPLQQEPEEVVPAEAQEIRPTRSTAGKRWLPRSAPPAPSRRTRERSSSAGWGTCSERLFTQRTVWLSRSAGGTPGRRGSGTPRNSIDPRPKTGIPLPEGDQPPHPVQQRRLLPSPCASTFTDMIPIHRVHDERRRQARHRVRSARSRRCGRWTTAWASGSRRGRPGGCCRPCRSRRRSTAIGAARQAHQQAVHQLHPAPVRCPASGARRRRMPTLIRILLVFAAYSLYI